VGAELKNTIAILKKDRLFLSSHIGDLTNLKAYEFFQESMGHLKTILKTDPDIIACDRHPSYLSTQWARQQNKKIYRIQHHHAHMAACMAENKIDKDVIAIILDGTGLGFDGKIWGGEIFSGNFTHLKREASLQLMPLPGGDAAVKEPWKMALAYLLECGLSEHELFADHNDADIIRQMWHKKINTPYTSSCGRLFDAASVIAGGREKIFYEAQAAIEFMNQVDINCQDSYKLPPNDKGVINIQALLSALLYDRHAGTDISVLAARFHNSLADLLTEQALRIRKNRQLNDIVLSGGVFQNKILFTRLSNNLYYNKFRVWSHEALPANDGSISAGQAVVAEALHNKGLQDVDFEDLLNKK
ncbi:MAG: carbamoyltransferase HypF, partial [Candidatus Marinimicrobia bacterium]|nr:carbamoyltransferase HypF [Candidatus Neomarinimicrobiota bacterium]